MHKGHTYSGLWSFCHLKHLFGHPNDQIAVGSQPILQEIKNPRYKFYMYTLLHSLLDREQISWFSIDFVQILLGYEKNKIDGLEDFFFAWF